MKQLGSILLLWILSMLAYPPRVAAQDQQFYQGKTIRVVVGFTSGGFYDRWSRLLVRHVPKYLPGNPEMVVQNMPGAGGMIAANHIYSVAKPDGLSVAMLSYGLYLDQLVGRKEVQSTRASSIGSVRRKKAKCLCICAAMRLINPSRTFATQARRPSAARRARRAPTIFWLA